MLSLMSLTIGISCAFIASALYLFIFHHQAHVKRMGTTSIEIDGLTIESETRVRWIPFLKPEVFEEFRILDEDNYYLLREKHPLASTEEEI